ncbi:MAG: hypothetical protein ACM3ZE_21085 [Myxococcales bacterium]
MKNTAVIAGVGAKTPLGLSAVETAFMYRTGLPCMREAPILNGREAPVTFCTVNTLPTHALAGARALSLGLDALHECTAECRRALGELKFRVLCCVDEFMAEIPEGVVSAAQYIADGLRRETREWFECKPDVLVQAAGAGGFGAMLLEGLAQLERGETQALLLGGLHSDYHPLRIQALDAAQRLFSPEQLDAVLPGEGAAFVLLTDANLARRLGWSSWGTVHAIGTAFERANPDNDESAYDAAGMTVALRSVAEALQGAELQVGWQLNDVGFERFRLSEWEAVSLRTHELWCDPQRVDPLPQRMGHQGGAVLPIHLAIAAEAWRRGWAPHERVISLCGSDSGARTAVLASSYGARSD